MENKNQQQYQHLGRKTFFLFVMKRSYLAFFSLAAAIALATIPGAFPSEYGKYLLMAVPFATAFFVFVCLITFLAGWLEYNNYGVLVSEDSFKIKRGMVRTEEIGIPYRYIKQVKINRNLTNQMMGLSDITICVMGDNDDAQFMTSDQSEIVITWVDKDLAVEIQDNILKKSEVEKVNMPQWAAPQGKI
ncbi:MAG: PH domain-containing protein [Candidatus Paceibacterota bacterium]|jgi:uncharacterized membrane protein YdbT with pleckstrin-like domain